MDIVKEFLAKDGSALASSMAGNFNLDSERLSRIFAELLPELNKGIQSKLASGPAGFTGLIRGIDLTLLGKAFSSDLPLAEEESRRLGDSLLNNIFDGSGARNDLIAKLSESSGVAKETLEQVVPRLTASFMSFFSRASGTAASQIVSS